MKARRGSRLAWGVLATGNISRQFASGLRASRTGVLARTGSRDSRVAEAFAAEFGGAGGSYAAVLDDPAVEAVYIGLPHHLHAEWTVRAAQAGKAILCEKPFTLDLPSAERALAEVERAGVFFMEAFMYRCHPQTRKVVELLAAGAIGEPALVEAEFGYAAPANWTNFRGVRELGGGALMDVGVYPLSFARMAFGAEPTRCEYAMRRSAQGYDAVGSGVLAFPGDRLASFSTAVELTLGNQATVYGPEGRIVVEQPWKARPEGRVLRYAPGAAEPDRTWSLGDSNDALYAHEADAVAEFFEAGECPYMTKADTLGNMAALDALRASAGLRFD